MQACKHNDVACCQNYTASVRQNPCPTICNMFPFFTLILHHSSDTTHLTHLTTLSETHLPATPPPLPPSSFFYVAHTLRYTTLSLCQIFLWSGVNYAAAAFLCVFHVTKLLPQFSFHFLHWICFPPHNRFPTFLFTSYIELSLHYIMLISHIASLPVAD